MDKSDTEKSHRTRFIHCYTLCVCVWIKQEKFFFFSLCERDAFGQTTKNKEDENKTDSLYFVLKHTTEHKTMIRCGLPRGLACLSSHQLRMSVFGTGGFGGGDRVSQAMLCVEILYLITFHLRLCIQRRNQRVTVLSQFFFLSFFPFSLLSRSPDLLRAEFCSLLCLSRFR